MTATIKDCPVEILDKVIQFLDIQSIFQLGQSCRFLWKYLDLKAVFDLFQLVRTKKPRQSIQEKKHKCTPFVLVVRTHSILKTTKLTSESVHSRTTTVSVIMPTLNARMWSVIEKILKRNFTCSVCMSVFTPDGGFYFDQRCKKRCKKSQ